MLSADVTKGKNGLRCLIGSLLVGLQDWFWEKVITCCIGLDNLLLTGCRQDSRKGWDRIFLWVLRELVNVTAVIV